MRLGRLLPLLIVLAPLALSASAAADDFSQIFGDYKADGQLDGCYQPDQLHNAGQSIPPDIEQYAPGFGDALSSAQTQCGSGNSQPADEPEAEEPPLVSAGTPGPGAPGIKKKRAIAEPPAPEVAPEVVSADLAAPELVPAAAAVSNDTPGALVALLVAAGLAVVLALAWTIAWFMGWSPERLTKPLFAAFQSVWDRVLPGR
jgi:hypothetical protein